MLGDVYMKRLFLGLMVVLLSFILFACESGETVTFSDTHLEDEIRTEIEKLDGDIYTSDLEEIVKLDFSGSEIESLDGIEAIVNLETLSLEDNNINDFSPLTKLNHLSEVNVIGNPFYSDEEQVKLLEKLT